MLLLIGAILSFGKVYKTQEKLQKILIYIGVPLILFLAVFLAKGTDWLALGRGLIGNGDGFWFIPAGLSLMTFLGAFAYSGAGGNLNLAQSFYIREKEYGMGKYGTKITSLLKKNKTNYSLEGKTFLINKENLKTFNGWWKKINLEHFLVFWLTGATTILMLSLLAFSMVYQSTKGASGINFLFEEAINISGQTWPMIGTIFLVLVGMMLFSTQLGVMDATARINSENLVILDQNRFKIQHLSYFYHAFLWIQIILGIVVLLVGFDQPLQLVTLSAFLNAMTMLVYTIAILWLNQKTLAKELRPVWWRKLILILIILFFASFTGLTLFG